MVDGDERDQAIRRTLRDNLGAEPLGTDHYLGLTRGEAERLAAAEGRRLVDRSQYFQSRRANLVVNRVNVEFDDRDIVVRADMG